MQHWKPYKPNDSSPWNFDRAKHLLRRAALGPTWSELQRAVKEGPEKSVDRILHSDCRIEGVRDDFADMSEVIGDAAASSSDANRLKAWWLYRMLFTPDPLRERITLLWHNHFATSNLKVQDLLLMQHQNQLFRENGFGEFGELLHDVLRDPAMLYWLDANSNRKGHPNENLARELMELFTLGVGHYSEDDVKAGARALTGWSPKRLKVRFVEERHDSGEKTILDKTANFDADGFAKLLVGHEATSQRLAWRLCTHFMGENVVNEAALTELASELRKRNLDIAWAVETILRSELFFSKKNIATRISSPIEFVVGTVRSLEILAPPPSTLILAEWCTRLGQDLFYPPNVGGWNGGRNWLTSRTIVGRSNFAAALIAGELRSPPTIPTVAKLADKFESLLLSAPCTDLVEGDDADKVAKLLSCPQAVLI